MWKDESCQLIPKKAGETIVTVHADPTDHYAEGAVDVKVIVKERDDIEEKITLQYEAGDGGSIAAVDAATGKILENGAKIKPNAVYGVSKFRLFCEKLGCKRRSI